MGRSSSCFNIIACGGGTSSDHDDSAVPENKGSNDKRGWSFRKKSARHRVLSNSVVTETPSGNKESLELNFHSPAEPAGPEKISLRTKLLDEAAGQKISLQAKPPVESAGPEKISEETKPPDESAGPEKIPPAEKIPMQNEPLPESAGPEKIPMQIEPLPESAGPEKISTQNEPLPESAVPEKVSLKNNPPSESVVQEKISVQTGTDEKSQLSTMVDSKIPEVALAADNNIEDDNKLEESVVIVIQAAIRGLLAQNELAKRKNIVKLQAAVRGHLVRLHAVGTLRCVQSIIRMQGLVRARLARRALEGSNAEDESGGKLDEVGCISTTLKKDNLADTSNVTYTSIEKLLGNSFARQLLESSPKTKSINIKCDPSKGNSAWKWLERWMSVSSAEPSPDAELTSQQNHQQEGHTNKDFSTQVLGKDFSEVSHESSDLEVHVKPVIAAPEAEENHFPCDAKNTNIDTCSGNLLSRDNLVQSQVECESVSNVKEMDTFSNQASQLGEISHTEFDSLSVEPEVEGDEQTEKPSKENSNGNLDLEEKFVHETEKEIDPAFVAQSQLEESSTSSTPTSGDGLGLNAISTGGNIVTGSQPEQLSTSDNSVPGNSMVQVGGSESGTELSISSTLDSPDRIAVEASECEFKDQVSKEGVQSSFGAGNVEVDDKNSSTIPESNLSLSVSEQLEKFEYADIDSSNSVMASECELKDKVSKEGVQSTYGAENVEVEDKNSPTIPECNLSLSVSEQLEKFDHNDRDSSNSVMAENSHEPVQKPEESALHIQRDLESETDHQSYINSVTAENSHEPEQKADESVLHPQRDLETERGYQSPEPASRSHLTHESQETPSSQISVKAERDGSDKNGSNHKRKSLSVGKRSPSSSNRKSSTKSSAEQLSKDQKTGKRRNSFGSTKHDDNARDSDHEPRDSGSNNTVPRFMQATESARAKIQANNSPRSSPDVHEKEVHTKKRQSLPGISGKQGSPRVQRTSHVQQDAKGNSSHSPKERKWQR